MDKVHSSHMECRAKSKVRILYSPPDHSIVPFCEFTLCLRKSGQSPRCKEPIQGLLDWGLDMWDHIWMSWPFQFISRTCSLHWTSPQEISRIKTIVFILLTLYTVICSGKQNTEKQARIFGTAWGLGCQKKHQDLCIAACIGNLWQHHFGSWKEVNAKDGAERPMLGRSSNESDTAIRTNTVWSFCPRNRSWIVLDSINTISPIISYNHPSCQPPTAARTRTRSSHHFFPASCTCGGNWRYHRNHSLWQKLMMIN